MFTYKLYQKDENIEKEAGIHTFKKMFSSFQFRTVSFYIKTFVS